MPKKKFPESKPKSDHRRAKRVILLENVQGTVVNSDGPPFRANLINVSVTGCEIYTSKVLNSGNRINLGLISPTDGSMVTFMGEVVRALKNPMKSMGRYAYGIRFSNLDTEKSQFLKEAVGTDE
jgi:c-di-GMP-binding flagellar brake protein YcgR